MCERVRCWGIKLHISSPSISQRMKAKCVKALSTHSLKGENINVCQTEKGEKQATDKRNENNIVHVLWTPSFMDDCVCCSFNKSINQDEEKKYYYYYLCACGILWGSLDEADNYMTMRRKEYNFCFTINICTIDAILVFAQAPKSNRIQICLSVVCTYVFRLFRFASFAGSLASYEAKNDAAQRKNKYWMHEFVQWDGAMHRERGRYWWGGMEREEERKIW